MTNGVMAREPVKIPRKPGVYALLNRKRRIGYVAFTSDLQKRSHSFAHMMQNQDTHWSIRGLPQHPAGEWVFVVTAEGVKPRDADKLIRETERQITKRNYTLCDGARAATPMVRFKGAEMSLIEAISQSKCRVRYITVWRRLSRGWSVEQALGLGDPPIRWSPADNKERRARAAARAA